LITAGHVALARGVAVKRINTVCRIKETSRVAIERFKAASCVEVAACVGKKGVIAICRVRFAVVVKKRLIAGGGVVAAELGSRNLVLLQRRNATGRWWIVDAGC
jgi:hypothetical protein